jgi:succinate dehydrogenase / fumarate reductase, membrane anchor subunit
MNAMRLCSPRAQGSFELYAWFFMRVSGVVMLLIAVGHLTYMHLVVGVNNIDYAWILQRWTNPFWRLYDWLLLAFALAHGTNGIRTVMDDYVPRGVRNVSLKWTLYVIALAFLAMGTQIILGAPKP